MEGLAVPGSVDALEDKYSNILRRTALALAKTGVSGLETFTEACAKGEVDFEEQITFFKSLRKRIEKDCGKGTVESVTDKPPDKE
ncbi:MAG: hypothetical protein ABH983_00695 [Candidatus Micrarchaeota archaeon]